MHALIVHDDQRGPYRLMPLTEDDIQHLPADRLLTHVCGFQTIVEERRFNASQTQSFNPGYILIFAPVFAGLWAWLGRRGRDPNPLFKFAVALVQVGLDFIVLVVGARFVDAGYREPLICLAVAYLLHTSGELCLSPIGLSQTTKLAPAALISTMMAVWYLGTSWAE